MNFEEGQLMRDSHGHLIKRDPNDPLGINNRLKGLLKNYVKKEFLDKLNDDSHEGGDSESHSCNSADDNREKLEENMLVGYMNGSIFGGCLTLCYFLTLIWVTLGQALIVMLEKEVEFT